ncbi:MAG: fructose-6-phosphate aldolase [Candidatus Thalassarchaeaceae archaeon]|jgi:transaldolase|nr:fructose-6-phosphate aldolase [Candidatus Thalassarchaeaceae archaeon]
MELILDTAEVSEVAEIAAWGVLSGVTTNPTLIRRSGGDFIDTVCQIADLCSGPISAEVTATDVEGMLEQAHELKRILPKNVIIKVPCNPEGLEVCRSLSNDGIGVNVTLVFSASQALLAAKAGAMYVSPFVGRIDDTGEDGMQLIREIMGIWTHYPQLETKVLAASIRSTEHVIECMKVGTHACTMPTKIFRELITHSLTDIGIEKFLADWSAVEAEGRSHSS